jgi:hypothetical protein
LQAELHEARAAGGPQGKFPLPEDTAGGGENPDNSRRGVAPSGLARIFPVAYDRSNGTTLTQGVSAMSQVRLPVLVLLLLLSPILAGNLPLPAGPAIPPGPEDSPGSILRAFTGIPYRTDGVIDEEGRYVLFARPEVRQKSPGLNCSGYVLAVSRFLFKRNISLAEAGLDRLRDSGPGSPCGQDWDLGRDLILNLSEGLSRTFLLPGNAFLSVEEATSLSPRGFDLHAPATWPELFSRLRPGHVYLLSFNKEVAGGTQLRHYHVAILSVDDAGDVWIHQTTGAAGASYGRNLSDPKNLAVFLRGFANTGKTRKYILVLEVRLPQ